MCIHIVVEKMHVIAIYIKEIIYSVSFCFHFSVLYGITSEFLHVHYFSKECFIFRSHAYSQFFGQKGAKRKTLYPNVDGQW
jgi:hypothetical protein